MRGTTKSDSKCGSKLSKGAWIGIIIGSVAALAGLIVLFCWIGGVFESKKFCVLKNEAGWKAEDHYDAIIKNGHGEATKFKVGEKIAFQCKDKDEDFHQIYPTEYKCDKNGSFNFKKLLECTQLPTLIEIEGLYSKSEDWKIHCNFDDDDADVKMEVRNNAVTLPNETSLVLRGSSYVGYDFGKKEDFNNKEYRCIAEKDGRR
jgi:hypothetical protein